MLFRYLLHRQLLLIFKVDLPPLACGPIFLRLLLRRVSPGYSPRMMPMLHIVASTLGDHH
jgi:hypothetical protein